MIDSASESLGHFAGEVSHDLLQPLTAILANAELLALEPAVAEDAEASRLAGATLVAGHRLARLIDTIHAYARAEVGATLTDVSLARVVEDIREDLGPVLTERDAVLEVSELPHVCADRHQVTVVLRNLIADAIQATPPDQTPEVRVTAGRDRAHWRISVDHDGRAWSLPEGLTTMTLRRVAAAHGGGVGTAGAAVWFTLPAVEDL